MKERIQNKENNKKQVTGFKRKEKLITQVHKNKYNFGDFIHTLCENKQNQKTHLKTKKILSPEKKKQSKKYQIENQKQIKKIEKNKNNQKLLKYLNQTKSLKKQLDVLMLHRSSNQFCEVDDKMQNKKKFQSKSQNHYSISPAKKSTSKDHTKNINQHIRLQSPIFKLEGRMPHRSHNPSIIFDRVYDHKRIQTEVGKSKKESLNASRSILGTKKNKKPKGKSDSDKKQLNIERHTPDTFRKKSNIKHVSRSINQFLNKKQLDPLDLSFKNSTIEYPAEVVSNRQIDKVLLTENDQLNVQELREFQIKGQILFKDDEKAEEAYLNEMAKKIQRCWRRYNTRNLLKRYTNNCYDKTQLLEPACISQKQVLGQHSKSIQKQNRQNAYDEKIKEIKLEEMRKWDNLIQLIQKSIENKNQEDTQYLLKKIAQQSESNKKDLQLKTRLATLQIKTRSKAEDYKLDKESSSQDSVNNPFQIFNTRKYRQILSGQKIENIFKSNIKILEQRKKKQQLMIEQRLENQQITSEKYNQKSEQIKKQINNEKKQYNKSRSLIGDAIAKAKEAVLKTKIDYIAIEKLKGNQIDLSNYISSEEALLSSKKNLSRQQDTFSDQDSSHELISYLNLNKYANDEDDQEKYQSETFRDRIKELEMKSSDMQNLLAEEEYVHSKRYSFKQRDQFKSIEYQQSQSFSSEQLVACRLYQLLEVNTDKEKASVNIGDEVENRLLSEFANQIKFEIHLIKQLRKKLEQVKGQQLTVVRRYLQNKNIQSKGIKTDLDTIRNFLDGLITYLFSNRQSILKRLYTSSGPTAQQMLKYIRSPEDYEPSSQQLCTTILSTAEDFEIYWKMIESTIKFERTFTNSQQKQYDRQNYLKGLTRLHYRAVFDSFNQSLELQRSYGIFGEPFPWKVLPKFKKQIDFEKTLNNALTRTLQSASSFCGLIFQRNDRSQAGTRYIKQINEQKLQLALIKDLEQSESKWTFYDDEQAQIMVQTASFFCDFVIYQMVRQLKKLL